VFYGTPLLSFFQPQDRGTRSRGCDEKIKGSSRVSALFSCFVQERDTSVLEIGHKHLVHGVFTGMTSGKGNIDQSQNTISKKKLGIAWEAMSTKRHHGIR
jgi:hypothetical protein